MKLPAASWGYPAKYSDPSAGAIGRHAETVTLLRQGYGGFSSPFSPQQATGQSAKENQRRKKTLLPRWLHPCKSADNHDSHWNHAHWPSPHPMTDPARCTSAPRTAIG